MTQTSRKCLLLRPVVRVHNEHELQRQKHDTVRVNWSYTLGVKIVPTTKLSHTIRGISSFRWTWCYSCHAFV